MRRMKRGHERARFDRWSFDDPSPAAPQARVDSSTSRLDSPPPRFVPRPLTASQSPWRKIQIPDAQRQRAAAAGLYRYVGKPAADMYDARRKPPADASRFAAMAVEEAPAPPRNDIAAATALADDEAATPPRRPATPAFPSARESAADRRNPHLGLTVGAILAVSLAVAVGLSWIATPDLDRGAALRADILQQITPPSAVATAPARAAELADSSIEVAPESPATVARPTARVQPIEVAP